MLLYKKAINISMNFKEFFHKDFLLNETPDISLQGKTAYADQEPLKTLPLVKVKENMAIIRQRDSGGFMAEGWTLVYFCDSAEAARNLEQGKTAYLIVPRGTWHSGGNPISDVWKKKFQQAGHEHILGMLEANTMPDEIYIDMMTVRPKYRRNGINTQMIDALKDIFPDAKVTYSSPTSDGEKFLKTYNRLSNKIEEHFRENHEFLKNQERNNPQYRDFID
jgi:GNAT superfamily N-acetyltransferase